MKVQVYTVESKRFNYLPFVFHHLLLCFIMHNAFPIIVKHFKTSLCQEGGQTLEQAF